MSLHSDVSRVRMLAAIAFLSLALSLACLPTTVTQPEERPTTEAPPMPTTTPTPTSAPPHAESQWIAFTSARDDGSGLQNLTNDPAGDSQPAWSPDGSGLTNLTNNPADQDRYPAWSPDGTQIAFASNRDGDFEIFVMNADGSNLRQLTHNSVEDIFPVWSHDGTQLAYQSASSLGSFADVWVINANGSGAFNLSDNPAQDRFPDWKP